MILTEMMPKTGSTRPDYGIDAPAVLRNLFLGGAVCLAIGLITPGHFVWHNVNFVTRGFLWPAAFLLAEAFLYLHYVLAGKLQHRDRMLRLHHWRGDERVLDVGCGRGLLLAGAARQLSSGQATGIDLWSNVDMGGNSAAATLRNLQLEGVEDRCTLLTAAAEQMSFADASFEVIVSNLCLHNIYDRSKRQQALGEIVRVLAPGGVALISDYKLTAEYAAFFGAAGLRVERQRALTFSPLTIVIARKPKVSSDQPVKPGWGGERPIRRSKHGIVDRSTESAGRATACALARGTGSRRV